MKKVLLCLGLLLSLSVCAGNLPLVKNGKSNAAIVIADDAVFSARYAADELASYIEKATGAKLPVLKESKSKQFKSVIYVGNTAAARKIGLTPDKFPQESFTIQEKNGSVYIVGGEATEEYLKLREALGLQNVHFLGFQKKDRLALIYKAADLFVLPTREDIWGLVINEALAYGLPTITTDRCVAGLELIEDGINGYVVPVEDASALAEKIKAVLASDLEAMGKAALEKVRPYTLENMAKTHAKIFESGR
jgi:glycosyltransferase involved in cell wall biosynthesis